MSATTDLTTEYARLAELTREGKAAREFLRTAQPDELSPVQRRMIERALENMRDQYRNALPVLLEDIELATKDFPKPESVAPRKSVQRVPNGTYTIVMGDERLTLRLKDDWRSNAQPGDQVAYFREGSEYKGCAFVNSRGGYVWKRVATNGKIARALDILLTGDWQQAGREYAIESGNCYICNRELTDPESIALGIGPVCRKNHGI